MQVKTRITNPTDQTQQYSWVPKYGIMIEGHSSVIIDGDLYTHNMAFPGNLKQMKFDEENKRVSITLLSDGKIEKLDVSKEPKKEPLPPAPPIPKNANPKGADLFAADVGSKANILGEGISEGTIDDAKGKAWNPMTGEESDVVKQPVVSIEDALWKEGVTLEDSVSTSDEKTIAVLEDGSAPLINIWTRVQLNSMKIGRLRAIAKSMGMPEVEAVTRKDVIEWILETQGNA
jgi:hypothetical protein